MFDDDDSVVGCVTFFILAFIIGIGILIGWVIWGGNSSEEATQEPKKVDSFTLPDDWCEQKGHYC